jgi:hypothetical protein
MNSVPQTEMPKYRCHKEVWALKIAAIETKADGGLRITPAEDSLYAPFDVEVQYVPKHEPARPQVGWYFVMYQDGYKSFSPAKAFEDGYTLIPRRER